MIRRQCANCAHWDSRDALVGFCPEITEHFRLDRAARVRGLSTCRTAAAGGCLFFEPSEEASREAHDEHLHALNLRAGAGQDYPVSLN